MRRVLIAAALACIWLGVSLEAATLTVCSSGCTFNNGQLQAALNAAACGDTITLQDGASYLGSFTLPSKNPCTTYTTLTRTGTLPTAYDVIPGCYQLGPTFAAEMAKRDACFAALKLLYETNAPKIYNNKANAQLGQGNVIGTAFDADYWKLQGLEIHSTNDGAPGITPTYVLVELGNNGVGGADATLLSQIPTHIVLDRISFHGLPSLGDVAHGVYAGAAYLEVTNSLFYGIKHDNDGGQCIQAINGPGPFLIENNYMQCGAENVLFGGGLPSIANLIPSDIVQTRNYMTKDWNMWSSCARLMTRDGYPCTYDGQNWSVKNLTECKNCQRNYIYGNVLEASWEQNQDGPIVLMQSLNDGNPGCTWCVVKDVYVYNNVLRHGVGGFQLGGKVATTLQMGSNIQMYNNLLYDLTGLFSGAGGAGGTSGGYALKASSGSSGGTPSGPYGGVRFDHNTIDTTGTFLAFNNSGDLFSTLVVTNNLSRTYGVGGDPGQYYDAAAVFDGFGSSGNGTAWTTYAQTSFTYNKNAIGTYAGQGTQPATTWFLTPSDWQAIFTDYATKNFIVASGSLYKAGGARQAIDAADMGVNMSLLPGGVAGPAIPDGSTRVRLPFIRVQ